MQHGSTLQALSNQQLVTALTDVARDLRVSECRLLAYLGEMDERRLALEMGYASLFAYCTEVLRFSEATTCRRIAAARVLRRYPGVGDQLAEGRLHVTAVAMLAPHLTPANHQGVLKQAEALTKRDLERLIATLAPRADQPDLMRRLPKKADTATAYFHTTTGEGEKRGSPVTAALPLTFEATPAAGDLTATSDAMAAGVTSRAVVKAAAGSATVTATTAAITTAPATAAARAAAVTTGPQLDPTTAKPRDQVLATAPARVLIRFSASERTAAKLERAKALLAHTCPDGRLEDVVDKALEALLDKLDPARKSARAEARKAAKAKADAAGSSEAKKDAKTSPVASIAPAFAPTFASVSKTATATAPTPAAPSAPALAALSAPISGTPSAPAAATTSSSAKHCTPASPTVASPAAASHCRHIPAEIRHAVWQRDQGRCTFVAKDGTRCPSRHALEFDHIHPFALGGSSVDADNIRLLCRTHNQLRAAKTFGPYRSSPPAYHSAASPRT